MKWLIFTFAMLGLVFTMSDRWMPWSNLIGIISFVIAFFILKWKEELK